MNTATSIITLLHYTSHLGSILAKLGNVALNTGRRAMLIGIRVNLLITLEVTIASPIVASGRLKSLLTHTTLNNRG
jgi:hypothetical protein